MHFFKFVLFKGKVTIEISDNCLPLDMLMDMNEYQNTVQKVIKLD